MTPEEVLKSLKEIKTETVQLWTIPLKVGPEDAFAAELIEIALEKLGTQAKSWELLGVSSCLSWQATTFCYCGDNAEGTVRLLASLEHLPMIDSHMGGIADDLLKIITERTGKDNAAIMSVVATFQWWVTTRLSLGEIQT